MNRMSEFHKGRFQGQAFSQPLAILFLAGYFW